jgi:CRP/FNR family transcriptional regulator, cyclic AMP receptor protein
MSASEPTEDIVARLRAVPVFQTLSAEQLASLAAQMATHRLRAGETLVAEGETGDEMFVLLRGRVRIAKRTLDDEQYTVAELGEQDRPFFGELALLDADRRSATIVAVQDSDLLALTRESYERFGNEHPQAGLAMARELAKLVSGHLRRANEDALLLFEALVNEVRSKTSL